MPIPRQSPVVRKRQDPNRIGHFEVHDVVGEPSYGSATDRQVRRNVWNWRSRIRPAGDEKRAHHRRLPGTRRQGRIVVARTMRPPPRVRQRLRSQCGTEGSPPCETSRQTVAHVCPRLSRGITGQGPTGAPFDLLRPSCLNRGWVFGAGVVETSQQFRGDIGAFIGRQRQRFPK